MRNLAYWKMRAVDLREMIEIAQNSSYKKMLEDAKDYADEDYADDKIRLIESIILIKQEGLQ
jgi:hypothetical protein